MYHDLHAHSEQYTRGREVKMWARHKCEMVIFLAQNMAQNS